MRARNGENGEWSGDGKLAAFRASWPPLFSVFRNRVLKSPHTKSTKSGFYTMCVPSAPLERLVPWVLRQQGDATHLGPPAAVEAVRTAVRRLADACQAYDPDEIRNKVGRRRG